jgi:hypothetical protein
VVKSKHYYYYYYYYYYYLLISQSVGHGENENTGLWPLPLALNNKVTAPVDTVILDPAKRKLVECVAVSVRDDVTER